MKKNVSKPDRFIRAALGLLVLITSFTQFFEDDLIENALSVLGIYLILTAIFSCCVLYSFLGIHSENPNKKMKMY